MRNKKIIAPAGLVLCVAVLGGVGCAGGPGSASQHGLDRQSIVAALQPGCGARFVQGDFDHDGASDYACMYDLGGADAVILVMRGTAAGPTEEVWWQSHIVPFEARSCGEHFIAGDFTGDDKTDLACLYEHGDRSMEIFVFTSAASGFEQSSWHQQIVSERESARCRSHFIAGDFDGNGRFDVACLYGGGNWGEEISVFLSTGSAFERSTWHRWSSADLGWERCATRFVVGDFGGDGLSDLSCSYDYGDGRGGVIVWRSESTHFELETWHQTGPTDLDLSGCDDRFVGGDFNGDGKTDLACLYDDGTRSQHIFVLKSESTRFELETWLHESAVEFDPDRCNGRFTVGQLDDDELDDLACMYDYGVGSGHPQGQAAQSRLFAFLSTGTDFGRGAVWPDAGTGPVPLEATHCSERLFIGTTPSPQAGGTLWGALSCGIDYGTLGIGVRHHLLNPHLLEFERPLRAVGDPLHAAYGDSTFVPRRLASCRAVETLVYDQPTLSYADVEYRQAKREGEALVLMGDEPPTAPFVVWIPDPPTEMIRGEAHYGDGVPFGRAFTALARAHPGLIRIVSFDEPYVFHPPFSKDKSLIRTGYAPFRRVLVDAAKTIHAHGIPVWVNFSRPEVELMTEDPPVPLNSPHFDLISIDWYHYGTDLLRTTDVNYWFKSNIQPLLEALHDLRLPLAWGAEYDGQRQHEVVVPDGFVFQPWNASEIQNVNDLFYAYSEWARATNHGQRDSPVVLQAPYAWSEHSIYNGFSVVPRLLRYWNDFNKLPRCP